MPPKHDRALAPDLARGAMLLFIALANAAGAALSGETALELKPQGVERLENLLLAVFVHARAYPVFAILFGYGLAQMQARGYQRAALVRRHLGLVALGAAHATLLYFGDFLGAYGLVGLAFTLLLMERGEWLHRLIVCVWLGSFGHTILLAVTTVSHASGGTAMLAPGTVESLRAATYWTAAAERLRHWPAHTLRVLPFGMIVWLGYWAGRRRWLEDLRAPRLLPVALLCLAVAWLGGAPLGLLAAGWTTANEPTRDAFVLLHQMSGMFGGPGYVALAGLAALHCQRTGVVARIAALGARSLSGYLAQSLAWLLLFAPYTLALPARVRPLGASLLAACLVWIGSVQAAWRLECLGAKGPAESLLRKWTFGG